ncbi:unnamed protein product, partial [Polarella glacialis]
MFSRWPELDWSRALSRRLPAAALCLVLATGPSLAALAGHPAYDPAEVNKEHIGSGVTLADDPEFSKVPEAAIALGDPGCEQALPAGWPEQRQLLVSHAAEDWQDAAYVSMEWLKLRGMKVTKVMDEEAKTCLFGVISMLYYLARYSLEEERSWESAVYLVRSLNSYASSMHPDKFDEGTDGGRRWPVIADDINRLRIQLARMSAN